MPPDPAASSDRPGILPPHVVVLLLLAGAAVLVARYAGALHEGALASGGLGPDVRQALGFGLFFNLGVGALIAAGLGAELLLGLVRLVRRRSPAGSVLARVVVASLPVVLFAGGHLLLNGRLLALARPLRGALGG